jgi:hypothetical protein
MWNSIQTRSRKLEVIAVVTQLTFWYIFVLSLAHSWLAMRQYSIPFAFPLATNFCDRFKLRIMCISLVLIFKCSWLRVGKFVGRSRAHSFDRWLAHKLLCERRPCVRRLFMVFSNWITNKNHLARCLTQFHFISLLPLFLRARSESEMCAHSSASSTVSTNCTCNR